jgi:CHAT domain-containing protein
LTAREIFNLKERMNADLVTVSACQTGLSDRRPGDELVGLTRSLLYAGASSIVVSLWSVAARSTMELMEEFYTQLKEGKDKATALQQAMIKVMKKPEYSHPYFWAPFLLVGDWE